MANGELVATYEVHCAQCEAPRLGIRAPLSRAKEELRAEGWANQTPGGWHCPACAKK